jgi:hypothetical protein
MTGNTRKAHGRHTNETAVCAVTGAIVTLALWLTLTHSYVAAGIVAGIGIILSFQLYD